MWSDRFIGIKWADKGRDRDGINCWGLHRLIFAEECGIEVPSYTEGYTSTEERLQIAALFDLTQEWPWRPVGAGAERAFDLAVFQTLAGVEVHCGTIVKPGLMIHIERGRLSCITTYTHTRRLAGIYRHVSLNP